MQLSGTLTSMPHCTAEPRMSCSFFTVSLPMCSSLLTWSSTLGISTLPAVRVRRVATCARAAGALAVRPIACPARPSQLHGVRAEGWVN